MRTFLIFKYKGPHGFDSPHYIRLLTTSGPRDILLEFVGLELGMYFMIEKRLIIKIALATFCIMPAYGMNLLMHPYDTLLLPEVYPDSCYQLAVWAEAGIRPAFGFVNGAHVNSLAIWNPNQDALAMLEGFPADSPITQLQTAINATDDGTRGHLVFNGNLNLNFGGVLGARWYFLPHAWITAYIPYYKASLNNLEIVDLTQNITAADMRVKTLLTDNLASIVSSLGSGLELTPWKRSGLGDLNLMVEWLFGFPQARPLLKNVDLCGRLGFTLPTGKRADINELFAFPFGWDGAVGLLFGGGLAVTLSQQFKAGFDVQLLHLFGNTRARRIKTATDQTELLLLATAPAYKDFGLTQRFNLFVQGYHLVQGFSLLVGYQFLKHGSDNLQLETCNYSNSIANSSLTLDEWIVHSMEFNAHYDFNVHMCQDSWIEPQASLFFRLPFNGKQSVAFTTIGVMVAADF